MKTASLRPPAEVTRLGFAALSERLGIVDAIRFVQQFDLGQGDYLQEREHLLNGDTVESLFQDIQVRRKKLRCKKG